MPIGFAVAALAMIGRRGRRAPSGSRSRMGLLFVGVPALDTLLVMVSRPAPAVSILTGGRDHLTHRTHAAGAHRARRSRSRSAARRP